MSFVLTTVVLTSAVNNAATLTVAYPAGTNQAFFTGANAAGSGQAVLNDNDVFPQAASGAGTVAFTYGSSDITVTNNSGATWPIGAKVTFMFDRFGDNRPGFRPGSPIADVDAAGGTYAQAEVNAAITALNQVLRELRVQGIIRSA